jgi:hypothetical protein
MAIATHRILGAKTVPNLMVKINRTDIVNDLTGGGTGAPLSAEQGKELKGLIDTEIGSRVSGDLAIVGGASAGYNTLKKIEDKVIENKTSAEDGINDLRTEINDSINVAIADLQSEDGIINGRISTEVSDRQTAISNEAATRQTAISNLDGVVAQEISDRASAVSNLDTSYKAADDILQNNIDAEKTSRELADNTEASARQAADSTLDGKITTEKTERISDVATLTAAIGAEVSNRVSADNALDSRMSAVETGMATGSKFKGNVANLAAFDAMSEGGQEAGWMYVVGQGTSGSRDAYVVVTDQSGDYVPSGWTVKSMVWLMDYADVTNVVTTERTARVAADTQLQNNINTLSGTVGSNKSVIEAALATLRTDMENADAAQSTAGSNEVSAVQSNLDAETSNREIADQALQTNLDGEIAARGAAITAEAATRDTADQALQANIDGETSARQTAVANEATARQSGDAANATAIQNEVTARQNSILSEEAARQASDTALSGRLDVIEGDELTNGSVRKALLDAKKYTDLYIAIPHLEGNDGSLVVQGNTVSLTYVPYRGVSGISLGEVIIYLADQTVMVSVENVVNNVITLSVATNNEYDGLQAKVQYWFVNADQVGSGIGVAGENGAGY